VGLFSGNPSTDIQGHPLHPQETLLSSLHLSLPQHPRATAGAPSLSLTIILCVWITHRHAFTGELMRMGCTGLMRMDCHDRYVWITHNQSVWITMIDTYGFIIIRRQG
jgi:hypothetical protein